MDIIQVDSGSPLELYRDVNSSVLDYLSASAFSRKAWSNPAIISAKRDKWLSFLMLLRHIKSKSDADGVYQWTSRSQKWILTRIAKSINYKDGELLINRGRFK